MWGASQWVLIRTVDGTQFQGETTLRSVHVGSQDIKLDQILSLHSGAALSESESARVSSGITAIQSTDRKARDLAVEELTMIGVPVATPLLKTYKDTDQHEPRPLYRLFERVMPSNADNFDRAKGIARLKNGEAIRGDFSGPSVDIVREDKSKESLPWSKIRVLAVRQKQIHKTMPVHTLRHCQQIEYLDTGVFLSSSAKVESTAKGFGRLSWDGDVWACDPDGLKKPAGGTYTSNLFEGQPFGALIGRVGSAGDNFLLGTKASKSGLPTGKLMMAVNDNRHWQNNLGTYTVSLNVTDAYDLGDAQ